MCVCVVYRDENCSDEHLSTAAERRYIHGASPLLSSPTTDTSFECFSFVFKTWLDWNVDNGNQFTHRCCVLYFVDSAISSYWAGFIHSNRLHSYSVQPGNSISFPLRKPFEQSSQYSQWQCRCPALSLYHNIDSINHPSPTLTWGQCFSRFWTPKICKWSVSPKIAILQSHLPRKVNMVS